MRSSATLRYGDPIGETWAEKRRLAGHSGADDFEKLETMGPHHGYGIARRIEQTSGDLLSVNYGTLYPALLKLEQEGYVASEWGVSDNNRKAKFYKLTRAGRKQLEREAREWSRLLRSSPASSRPRSTDECPCCSPLQRRGRLARGGQA